MSVSAFSSNMFFTRITERIKQIKGKGALSILIGNSLIKAASFLGSIVLVRFMVKEQYGVLGYLENLYTYANMVTGYGLGYAVLRYVILKKDDAGKAGVLNYIVRRGSLFNILLVVLLSVIALTYPHSKEFAQASQLLPVMLIALPFEYLMGVGTYTLRAFFLNNAYAVFAVLVATMVWVLKIVGNQLNGLYGTVLSWPLSYGVMSLLVFIYIRRHVLSFKRMTPLTSAEKRAIDIYSIQYMITNGLWVMFRQNDVFLLGMLTGNAEYIASYRVAYTIPAAMSIISSSIGIFVAPYFVKNEENKTWVWKNYLTLIAATSTMLGIITILIFVLAKPIVIFVYGEQYMDSVYVMRILLIAVFLGNAIRYTTANLLSAMGKVSTNMIVSIFGIVLQIILDLKLIPIYGMIGAAFSSVLVYLAMSVMLVVSFTTTYNV